MDQKILLKERMRQWINDNRPKLPMNIDSWKVEVYNKEPGTDSPAPRTPLGKYNALLAVSAPFYKPYSKMGIF